MWRNELLWPYPQLLSFLSFCCFNLAKHQTLEQSLSFTSSIPWRHGQLSASGITVHSLTAMPPSLASSLSVLHSHRSGIPRMNLIVLTLSFKSFMGFLQSGELKIRIPQTGKSLLEIWPLLIKVLLDLLTFPHFLCIPDILTSCISLNVHVVFMPLNI